MTSQRYTNLNGAAIVAARVPLWQTLATEMKLAAVIGSALAAFVIPIGIALHAGGYIGAVKMQDITDLSGKVDGLAKTVTDLSENVTTIKKGVASLSRDRGVSVAQLESLQSDVTSLRSDNRAFVTAIEELKVQISAPPPLPTRKPAPHTKTAANKPSIKSLLIGEAR